MKILIAYATKNGTTRECAELLAKQLKNHEIELLRVGKDGEAVPEIDGYDVVIFGSNVRMAKIDRELSEYLKKNEDKI
ncbi:MAG: flavodoxin, partial [Clostridia bacterium]|nr:flavodoxin [Clostridia bacterium]